MPRELRPRPHIRAFVVDANGTPLPNVDVIASGETSAGGRIALGILRSDHAGYVSFDAGLLDRAADLTKLRVYPRLSERSGVDIDVRAVRGNADMPPVIVVADKKGEPPRGPVTASVHAPNEVDWRLSPGSLAANPSLTLGSGPCQTLVPGNHATYEFGYRQLVRTAGDAERANGPRNQRMNVRQGWVDEFRISWYPLGHSLGQLVHSLPLAPCESVNIAVVDWSRTDSATRGEAGLIGEQLVHSQRRDRTITETVGAAFKELQQGGSVVTGAAAAGRIYGIVPIVGSLGGGYFASSGSRDVTSETVQTVADQIVQSSNSIRELSSTVVVEASQAESDVLQTRTVTNHNHCHALTVLYYEVLRHYRVVTEWVGRQDVLFLEHDVETFEREDLICHREALERVLLDSELRAGLDAARRLATNTSVAVQPPPSRRLEMLIVHTGTGSDGTNGDVFFRVQLDDGTTRRWKLDVTNVDNFEPNQNERFAIGRDRLQGITVDRITMIGFEIRPVPPIELPDPWLLATLRVDYVLIGQPGVNVLFQDEGLNRQFQGRDEWWISVDPPPLEDAPEPVSTVETDTAAEATLLRHLNCHRVRYRSAIWFDEDPNERAHRLDAFNFRGGSVLDAIANTPLGLFGNYMAFPSRASQASADVDEPVPPVERVVSLPTRGVFAEAQLSHCNACEERDVTRSSDWSKSPCAPAPPITGVQPGSRAQQQDLQPSQLPAPVTTIVNAPAVPDPTGMAGVLNLLGTRDIFRDMSNAQAVTALLQDLAEGAVSMDQAQQMAQQLQGALGNGSRGGTSRAGGGGGFGGSPSIGGSGGTGSQQMRRQPPPADQHDQLQIWRDALRRNETTAERHNQRVDDYLNNPYGITTASFSGDTTSDRTGTGSTAEAPEWAQEVEESNVWHDFFEGLVEEVAGEVPLVDLILHARDLGVAFGERVEQGILAARNERGGYQEIYHDLTVGEITQEKIDRYRNRGLELTQATVETLRQGMLGLLEELESKIAQSVVGGLTEPLIKLGADRFGDFLGDLMTGDHVEWLDFISQAGEDQVQEFAAQLAEAITATIQEQSLEAVVEGLRAEGLTPLQIMQQLSSVSVSAATALYHLDGISLDDVVASIDAKLSAGALRGPDWQGSVDNYLLDVDHVRTLVAQYEAISFAVLTDEGQAKKDEVAEALQKLSGSIEVLEYAFKPGPAFKVDLETAAVKRMAAETSSSRRPVLEL